MPPTDQRAHLAECRDEAAAALPAVARAVEAWSAVRRGVRACDWETIDEFNAVWDERMATGAGEPRAVLAEIAGRITDVIAPADMVGDGPDEPARHLTSH